MSGQLQVKTYIKVLHHQVPSIESILTSTWVMNGKGTSTKWHAVQLVTSWFSLKLQFRGRFAMISPEVLKLEDHVQAKTMHQGFVATCAAKNKLVKVCSQGLDQNQALESHIYNLENTASTHRISQGSW
jgi:hypothetical protein